MKVSLLLSASGQVRGVYESEADAKAQFEKYNADPFIEEGTPDPDAPYSIETWVVQSPARKAVAS